MSPTNEQVPLIPPPSSFSLVETNDGWSVHHRNRWHRELRRLAEEVRSLKDFVDRGTPARRAYGSESGLGERKPVETAA